jgi:hypothetical protein
MATSRLAVATLLGSLALFQHVEGFYLPGVNPQSFKEGDV